MPFSWTNNLKGCLTIPDVPEILRHMENWISVILVVQKQRSQWILNYTIDKKCSITKINLFCHSLVQSFQFGKKKKDLLVLFGKKGFTSASVSNKHAFIFQFRGEMSQDLKTMPPLQEQVSKQVSAYDKMIMIFQHNQIKSSSVHTKHPPPYSEHTVWPPRITTIQHTLMSSVLHNIHLNSSCIEVQSIIYNYRWFSPWAY